MAQTIILTFSDTIGDSPLSRTTVPKSAIFPPYKTQNTYAQHEYPFYALEYHVITRPRPGINLHVFNSIEYWPSKPSRFFFYQNNNLGADLEYCIRYAGSYHL